MLRSIGLISLLSLIPAALGQQEESPPPSPSNSPQPCRSDDPVIQCIGTERTEMATPYCARLLNLPQFTTSKTYTKTIYTAVIETPPPNQWLPWYRRAEPTPASDSGSVLQALEGKLKRETEPTPTRQFSRRRENDIAACFNRYPVPWRSHACSCLCIQPRTINTWTTQTTTITTAFACKQTDAVLDGDFENPSQGISWHFEDYPGGDSGVRDWEGNHYGFIGFEDESIDNSISLMGQRLSLCPDVPYNLEFDGRFHMQEGHNCSVQIFLDSQEKPMLLQYTFPPGSDGGWKWYNLQGQESIIPQEEYGTLIFLFQCAGNGTVSSDWINVDNVSFKPAWSIGDPPPSPSPSSSPSPSPSASSSGSGSPT